AARSLRAHPARGDQRQRPPSRPCRRRRQRRIAFHRRHRERGLRRPEPPRPPASRQPRARRHPGPARPRPRHPRLRTRGIRRMSYQLWYWPDIPGRGEFVRLALEAAEIDYEDMAREKGAEALVEDMAGRTGFKPFAPPYLVEDDFCIGQTAHILA